jgi:hypothetical protein
LRKGWLLNQLKIPLLKPYFSIIIKNFNPRLFFLELGATFVRKITKKAPVNLEKMLEKGFLEKDLTLLFLP